MMYKKFPIIAFTGFLGILLILFFMFSRVLGIETDAYELNNRSKDYYGFYGIYLLAQKSGFKVENSNVTNFKPENNTTVIYTDYSEKDPFLTNDILNWIKNGNSLIVDYKLYNFIFDTKIDLVVDSVKVNFIPDILLKLSIESNKFLNIDKVKFFDSIEVISESQSGAHITKGKYGGGSVYIVPNMSMFNNYIFEYKEKDKAAIFYYILQQLDSKKIYFREQIITYSENPSFIKELFSGKYRYLTWQISLIFFLGVIFYAKRFIRKPSLEQKKQRLITEHIDAVANLYKKANATELINDIDIEFLEKVILRNKRPAGYEDKIDEAIKEKDITKGFRLRDNLINSLKRRKNE